MRRLLLPLAAVFLVGCPDIGRMTYRFDLVSGQGTLTLDDIGTDDPASAVTDFANLVNDYLLGSKVQDEHPSWRVGERRLYENGGRLDGIVVFTFDRAADVGLYQHTKKSEYLWCGKDGETVVSTSGEIVPPYPNCVVFHRKDKQFEVTVTTGSGLGGRTSLLPLYLAWNGGAVPVADSPVDGAVGDLVGDAFRSMFGTTPDLPDAPNLDRKSVV